MQLQWREHPMWGRGGGVAGLNVSSLMESRAKQGNRAMEKLLKQCQLLVHIPKTWISTCTKAGPYQLDRMHQEERQQGTAHLGNEFIWWKYEFQFMSPPESADFSPLYFKYLSAA
jgi:hypothetical protein